MIRATIKYPGIFIDKPHTTIIEFSEDDIAMEKKNEDTGRFEKLTVGQIFDVFFSRRTYIRDNREPEDIIDHTYFEMWFNEKHIKNKPYHNRIIDLKFEKINETS
jgi:hypothetical protein